jgi:hypothetical protein
VDVGSILLLVFAGGLVLLARLVYRRSRQSLPPPDRDASSASAHVQEDPARVADGTLPRSRPDPPPGESHPMAVTLLLVVVGAALVVLDLDVNHLPLIPDGLGYGLLAIAGIRLATFEGQVPGTSLKRTGAGLSVVATISAIDWLLALAGRRPAPEVATGAAAWFDAALLLATIGVGVLLLCLLAPWFAERNLGRAAQRLRFGAVALGLTWGTFALLASVATIVLHTWDRPAVHFETPWVIPVVLVMFAALGYCAWALLSARADLRRPLSGVAVPRSVGR